jgi:hypothetical protein
VKSRAVDGGYSAIALEARIRGFNAMLVIPLSSAAVTDTTHARAPGNKNNIFGTVSAALPHNRAEWPREEGNTEDSNSLLGA